MSNYPLSFYFDNDSGKTGIRFTSLFEDYIPTNKLWCCRFCERTVSSGQSYMFVVKVNMIQQIKQVLRRQSLLLISNHLQGWHYVTVGTARRIEEFCNSIGIRSLRQAKIGKDRGRQKVKESPWCRLRGRLSKNTHILAIERRSSDDKISQAFGIFTVYCKFCGFRALSNRHGVVRQATSYL